MSLHHFMDQRSRAIRKSRLKKEMCLIRCRDWKRLIDLTCCWIGLLIEGLQYSNDILRPV
jgi:hypothetical protein